MKVLISPQDRLGVIHSVLDELIKDRTMPQSSADSFSLFTSIIQVCGIEWMDKVDSKQDAIFILEEMISSSF